jgi:large subunit ribosomal protein LX
MGRYFPILLGSVGMSTFTVRGSFPARDGAQDFEKEVEAPNEDVATEHVYSRFGSEHNLKRTQVTIEEVSA